MIKPKEVDYTSHVAYTRDLEVYCAEVEAELSVQTKAADHWLAEACRDHNALEKIIQQNPVAAGAKE
jgi:hypothetical protein